MSKKVIRKLVRNWLGIDNYEEEIDENVRKERMMTRIGFALEGLLAGEIDDIHGRNYMSKERSVFQSTLKLYASEAVEQVSFERLEKRINGEKFIDDVVARINRKQV